MTWHETEAYQQCLQHLQHSLRCTGLFQYLEIDAPEDPATNPFGCLTGCSVASCQTHSLPCPSLIGWTSTGFHEGVRLHLEKPVQVDFQNSTAQVGKESLLPSLLALLDQQSLHGRQTCITSIPKYEQFQLDLALAPDSTTLLQKSPLP